MNKRHSRIGWLLGITVIAIGLVTALALVSPRNTIGQGTNMSETASQPAELSVEHVIRVLGGFQERPDIFRKYILIPDNLSDEQLIAMFRQLNKIEPDTWYYLMDSDSHFDQMISALPETRNNDYSNWPRDYVEKHYVARLRQEIRGEVDNRERFWVVSGALVREHLEVDLD